MANKNDDYGYFGKGIDGYVHYKQAFDRNFSENNQYNLSVSTHNNRRSTNQANTTNKRKESKRLQKQRAKIARQDAKMKETSGLKIVIMLALTWLAMMFGIIGIPTLILTLLTGSYSAAASGIGILILLGGIVFIIFH